MIINEDYFDMLDIEDEDINISDELQDSLNSTPDVESLENYLISKYERCISISTDWYCCSYKNDEQWVSTIHRMIDRISYLFDTYGMDYEYVFVDNTNNVEETKPMTTFKVGDITIYSTDDFFDCKSADKFLHIMFYVNFPKKFNYMESYFFVDRLQKTLWKTEDSNLFYWLNISKNPCRITTMYRDFIPAVGISKDDANELITQRRFPRQTIRPYIKKFFEQALICFNDTPEDVNNIRKMYDDFCWNNINPFAKRKQE